MADPTPVRGIATVAQIEALLRPVSTKYNDFKYHNDTQPTIQTVCDFIDQAYDKLVPLFISYGINIPIPPGIVYNYCSILNALQAAIDVEVFVHSGAPPKTTTKEQKLRSEFDRLLLMLKAELTLPPIGDDGNPTTNDKRPITTLAGAMYSSMVDVTDDSKFDRGISKDILFRLNKEF